MNYYNEIDHSAADWIESLINQGLIPPGDVDRRSIVEVQPHELTNYTQCHFFAGIAGWAYALQLAGWPADRAVWTGSCPCQPFSAAGRGKGTDDERHIWPEFYRLIRECRPPAVFGEQVSGKAGMQWLDHVQDDLEASAYAVGSVTFPACSLSSPHLRQRLYWGASSMGDTNRQPAGRDSRAGPEAERGVELRAECDAPGAPVSASRLGNADSQRHNRQPILQREERGEAFKTAGTGSVGRLADTSQPGCEGWLRGRADQEREAVNGCSGRDGAVGWSNPEWIECRDGKIRPTQSSLKPLADGLPGSVVPGGYSRFPVTESGAPEQEARGMRLKGYGNAIVPQQAAEFIQAFEDARQINREEQNR